MQHSKRNEKVDLALLFRGAHDDALDLLRAMLRFSPAARITVDQALAHPFLAAARQPDRETTCPTPMMFEFEERAEGRGNLLSNVVSEITHYL